MHESNLLREEWWEIHRWSSGVEAANVKSFNFISAASGWTIAATSSESEFIDIVRGSKVDVGGGVRMAGMCVNSWSKLPTSVAFFYPD